MWPQRVNYNLHLKLLFTCVPRGLAARQSRRATRNAIHLPARQSVNHGAMRRCRICVYRRDKGESRPLNRPQGPRFSFIALDSMFLLYSIEEEDTCHMRRKMHVICEVSHAQKDSSRWPACPPHRFALNKPSSSSWWSNLEESLVQAMIECVLYI
jgi:hypothetical protein